MAGSLDFSDLVLGQGCCLCGGVSGWLSGIPTAIQTEEPQSSGARMGGEREHQKGGLLAPNTKFKRNGLAFLQIPAIPEAGRHDFNARALPNFS